MLARVACSLAAFLLLSFCCAKTFAQDSRTPTSHSSHPAYAKTVHVHGISDVGKLNDSLYRGSQPNEPGLRELKKPGVTTIVDLRGEKQGLVKSERKSAQALGMHVVNIRASGWSPPQDQQIAAFLSLT